MASPHKAAAEGMAAGLPESPTAAVIDDLDIGTAALLILKRCKDDAMLEASERADQPLDEGDMAGAETWHRILNAIERLQAKAPAEGEKARNG